MYAYSCSRKNNYLFKIIYLIVNAVSIDSKTKECWCHIRAGSAKSLPPLAKNAIKYFYTAMWRMFLTQPRQYVQEEWLFKTSYITGYVKKDEIKRIHRNHLAYERFLEGPCQPSGTSTLFSSFLSQKHFVSVLYRRIGG